MEVTGEVGNADLGPGSGDTDGADKQPHAVLLSGEHVLDRRADSVALGIGTGDVLGQRPKRHAPLVDVGLEHAPLDERLVFLRSTGRVGPYARTSVLLADQFLQLCTIMGVGGAGSPGADQPMGPIDADVVFVAEHRDGIKRCSQATRGLGRNSSVREVGGRWRGWLASRSDKCAG